MLKVFEYQQQYLVAFDYTDGELMVNATQMALPFGKKPNHFLRLTSTNDYINALEKRVAKSQLVKVIYGDNGGTWMHRKLALRFAQWLSPEFALWVDEQIEELLTKGRASLSASPLDILKQQVAILEDQERRVSALETSVTQVRAKVENINTDYYALSGYFVLRGRRFDLTKTEAQQYGKKLTRASGMNGHVVRKTYHEKYGSVNTYHVDVLKAVLGF